MTCWRRATNASWDDIAIIRLEQLYPLRPTELKAALAPYSQSAELVWVQEEPWNMGSWFFINARLPELLERSIRCVSRPESASPATGSFQAHHIEQTRLVEQALD